MTQYNREELSLLNQVFFALFLVADFALFLYFYHTEFPWFALIGFGIGLFIIVLCWTGKKYTYFLASLLVCTGLFSLVYNWHAIIH
ncbi:hypothetical protein [Psychrobacillus sp. FJAT-21963]|uniref:hypothetical protein n=1 Tax=Psychrobacillus sp. FJAT-21963 TaxID=1712028 RepID=UPI0006FB12CE|nr:hypothetical protein [Psychrobacillus sp. FJAT-21963]KQL35372.1 hypothetical protein AN959_10625 [Psychrobacillus sp. FJAT-21963]